MQGCLIPLTIAGSRGGLGVILLAEVSLIGACLFLVLSLTCPLLGQTPIDESKLIHFGDVIDVDVVGSLEFDWRGKLNPEGFLDGMNTYGEPVYGLCRSESEVAEVTSAALSRTLKDPKVIVRIVDRSNRAVATVDGAVRSPQRFDLRRPAKLQELLILAGGVSDDASGEVQIFRPLGLNCFPREEPSESVDVTKPVALSSDVPSLTIVKIPELLAGDPRANILIRSGDLITVMHSAPVYIVGGVNDPRQIVSRPDLTLGRAIAMAGGVAKDGDPSGVTIYRRLGQRSTLVRADLSKIQTGAAADPLIFPMDVIEVRQKNKTSHNYAPVVEGGRGVRPPVLPLRIIE